MPGTVKQLSKEELAARVSVLQYRKAQQYYNAACLQLEQAADANFADVNVVRLLELYKEAKDDLEQAEKGLGSGGNIDAKQKKALEQFVQEKHEALPGLKAAGAMTEADFRTQQQDFERARIEQEGRLAQMGQTAAAQPFVPPADAEDVEARPKAGASK